MGQNTDRARIFGDSFVDLDVKASRRRNGAERADPPTPGVSSVEGARPGKEPRGKTVRGGRDALTKNGSDQAENHRYMFM